MIEPTPSSRLYVTLQLDIAELPILRGQIRAFLKGHDVDDDVTDDVLLCVQEAAKNALQVTPPDQQVLITVERKAESLSATVRDRGAGIDPGQIGLEPDPGSESGRGLLIIYALMDDVVITSRRGTEVLMRRSLPAVPGRLTRTPPEDRAEAA